MFSWGELFSTFMARKIMRAKHSFRTPNRGGGCLFLYALYIASGALFHPASRVPFPLSSWQIFRQSGQKLDFICSLWCFLGILGDRKRQNLRYILISGLSWCCFHPLLWWRWSCPLGAGGAGCRGFLCPAVCVPSLSPCLLSAFLLCLWCIACEICLVSHFEGFFSGFYMFGVGLCCLGALRGLCGFVRVYS